MTRCDPIPISGLFWHRYGPWRRGISSPSSCARPAAHSLEVTFVDEEDLQQPWRRPALPRQPLAGAIPTSLVVTLANLLCFDKTGLPQPLASRLIRLAAFQNPEFHEAQAMLRRSGISHA